MQRRQYWFAVALCLNQDTKEFILATEAFIELISTNICTVYIFMTLNLAYYENFSVLKSELLYYIIYNAYFKVPAS